MTLALDAITGVGVDDWIRATLACRSLSANQAPL